MSVAVYEWEWVHFYIVFQRYDGKRQKGKMSKGKNVENKNIESNKYSDDAGARVRVRVSKIFTSIYYRFHDF
jgi:hypothetical protein